MIRLKCFASVLQMLVHLALVNLSCSAFDTNKYYVQRRSCDLSSRNMFWYRTTSIYSSRVRGKDVHGSKTLSMDLEITIRIIPKKYCLPDAPHTNHSERQDPPKNPLITDLVVTTQWHKNNDELIRGTDSDSAKGRQIVLLDPLGELLTEEKFSTNMNKWFECGKNRLTFVIGGSYGLPEELKSNYGSQMLSVSYADVFSPDYTRILLMEKIYRTSELRNTIPKERLRSKYL